MPLMLPFFVGLALLSVASGFTGFTSPHSQRFSSIQRQQHQQQNKGSYTSLHVPLLQEMQMQQHAQRKSSLSLSSTTDTVEDGGRWPPFVAHPYVPSNVVQVLNKLTNLFPLWVLAFSAAGIANPAMFTWFLPLITPALTLTMVSEPQPPPQIQQLAIHLDGEHVS
jgi:hypothetical protein